MGRKPKLTTHQRTEALRRREAGEPLVDIARSYAVRGSLPGERRGGRQKGTLNKRTVEMLAEIEAGGEMPLAYMLRVMRDESVPMAGRMEAAARAAPYCHAKLANVELTAAVQVEQPPIDFSMLDVEERQQLRAMLERRRGPVPVGLGDGSVDYASPAADDDLEDAA